MHRGTQPKRALKIARVKYIVVLHCSLMSALLGKHLVACEERRTQVLLAIIILKEGTAG